MPLNCDDTMTQTSFFHTHLFFMVYRRWINSSRKWEVCRELSHTKRVFLPLSIRPSFIHWVNAPQLFSHGSFSLHHPAAGEKLSVHRCHCSQDPFCSCHLQSWWKHSLGLVAAAARPVNGTFGLYGSWSYSVCSKGRRWFSWDCEHWLAGDWSCKIGFGLYPRSKKGLDTFVALSIFPWLSGVTGTW